MVRCLGIFFCLLVARVSLGQCPNIPIEKYDCLTGNLNYSLVVSGPTPLTVSVSPSYPFTVTGGTICMTFSNAVGSILISYTTANNCVSQGNPSIFSGNFNQYFGISLLSPFTKTVTCFGFNDGALSFTATGTNVVPPVSYSVNGTAISSTTVNNLAAGIYTIAAQGSDGCKRTQTVSIIQSNQITTTSTSSVACFSSTVGAVLSTTGGVNPMSYTVNGNPVSGNTVALSAGTYTVLTKDVNGCTGTNTITINQPPATVFNFGPTQPSCPTSSNGALSVNIINMQAPFSYTWTAPTNTNATISNIPQGIYTLTVRDAKNCVFTNTFHLLPISNIQTTVNTKPETCSAVDAAATINVTGGTLPLTYSVNSFPSQSSNTFSNLATGIYTVIVTDANTCSLVSTFSVGNTSPVQLSIISQTDILCYNNCDGKLTVSVSAAVMPVTYSLTSLPPYTTSTLTNICAGTYTLRAVDNIGCYAVTTVTFTNPAPYSFSVTGNSPICIGKNANLTGQANGGTAPYSYVWSPGGMTTSSVSVSPTITTAYSLSVFDSKNCTLNPATFTVFVRAPITVSVSPQNSGICPGTTAQITPSVSGGDGNYTYQWLPGNDNTASIFLSNLTNPTYTFMVSDGCGSPTNTTVIHLQIFPVTVPTFKSDTAIGCQPLCVQFKNTTPGSTNHYWNFGDVPFEQNVQDPYYCYTRSGSFNVKLSLTDVNGCKVSATYSNYINVLQQPSPNFITKPEILTDDLGSAQLLNSSGNASSISWYLDGVYQGSDERTSIPCTDTICYVVKLIANNSNGCKDSLERMLCVKPGFTFYMPNTFTPNNDGKNDELLPYGRSWLSDNYKFRIFNRWGQMIFQTNDIKKGWDGKMKGNFALNDNYYWMVFVTDYYGNEHAFQGSVVLLR